MAIDSWLLQQHRQGLHPPALRFYGWSPPAISLGYHQRRYPKEWEAIAWRGKPLELVRRPTGGRAVLHQGDLTYAIVTSGFEGKRWDIYETLCEFLVRGWRSLGVQLHYGSAGRGYAGNPNCFGTATGADLVMSDGTKLIGSAQVRRGGAILQHGSIRLSPDRDLFDRVFGEPIRRDRFPDIPIPEIIEALSEAARDCFGVRFETQPLSEEEWKAIGDGQIGR